MGTKQTFLLNIKSCGVNILSNVGLSFIVKITDEAPLQPLIGSMVEEVVTEMDPEQGVDDEYKKKHNPSYCWKFYRNVSLNDVRMLDSSQCKDDKEVNGKKLRLEETAIKFVRDHNLFSR
jgi:hypothetical protein